MYSGSVLKKGEQLKTKRAMELYKKLAENNDRIPWILGDWNEECVGNSTTNKLCERFGLVDAREVMNPDCPPFPTFEGGSKRIDYLLTSPVAISHIESF